MKASGMKIGRVISPSHVVDFFHITELFHLGIVLLYVANTLVHKWMESL